MVHGPPAGVHAIDGRQPAIPDDFFEPLPPPPPVQRVATPPWAAPPRDEFAALVPDRRVLARGRDRAVVLLSHVDVFSTGCRLAVRACVQHDEGMDEQAWMQVKDRFRRGGHPFPPPGGSQDPSDGLRFGVLFADGSKATTGGLPWRASPHDEEPDGPVLRQWGGSGGGDDHVVDTSWMLWLWPLPPAAPFDVVVSWREFGIDRQRQTLDGAAIRRAVGDVRQLAEE